MLTDTAAGGRPPAPVRPGKPAGAGKRYEYRTVILQGPCPVTPTEPNPQLVAYEQRELPDGQWERTGGGCTGNPAAPVDPTLDLGAIYNTALTVRATVRPPQPTLTVQPRGGALLNQPAIFYVTDPGPAPTASATNPLSGRVVTVTLTAPTYDWDFGDTTTRQGLTTTGQPHINGSPAPAEGAGDPYISHTYRQPDPDGLPVTVTATYRVSYTYTGNTSGPLPLEPLVVTDTQRLRVRSARSELVSN